MRPLQESNSVGRAKLSLSGFPSQDVWSTGLTLDLTQRQVTSTGDALTWEELPRHHLHPVIHSKLAKSSCTALLLAKRPQADLLPCLATLLCSTQLHQVTTLLERLHLTPPHLAQTWEAQVTPLGCSCCFSQWIFSPSVRTTPAVVLLFFHQLTETLNKH